MAIIRPEGAGDAAAVARVNAAAFGRPGEAELVDRLRSAGATALSLVAELDGEVVGHVLFSPVTLDPPQPGWRAVGLAPMSVAPPHQRRGIGSRLVREALGELRRLGHPAVVVLGHPGYYPRFGFVRASTFGLRCAYPNAEEAFMALELEPAALAGRPGVVRYRPELDAV